MGQRCFVQESEIDQGSDELREALVAQCTTDDGTGFRDLVRFTEAARVSVGVSDEREGWGDVVRLGVRHELLAVNGDELTVLVEFGRVAER